MLCADVVIEPEPQAGSVGNAEAAIHLDLWWLVDELEYLGVREVVEVLEDADVGHRWGKVEVGHGAVGAAHVVWSELQLSLEELTPCGIADLGRLLG